MAMAGEDDPPPFLASVVGGFLRDRLAHRDRRLRHKDLCAERLASGAAASVPYSDQAVLANLDWGIDALEDAIATTSSAEARLARLDHAERMLRVCAMLDPALATAGVPNSYLSAWAHLHLAYVWALRDGGASGSDAGRQAVRHILEMFAVDTFFSRVDFAPELWEALFLPHMDSIVGWYSEARQRVLAEAVPDSTDISNPVGNGDSYAGVLFDESLLLSLRPGEADKLRELETAYGHFLDDSTGLYAKYYLDCLSQVPVYPGGKKGAVPMTTIAKPPMMPSHGVSPSIPDYVKFGPILPKSAGFPSLPREKQKDESNSGAASREALYVRNEETNYSGRFDVSTDSDISGNFLIDSDSRASKFIATNTAESIENGRNGSRTPSSSNKCDSGSPTVISPVDSTEASSKAPCSKTVDRSKGAPKKLIRLSSSRIRDPPLKPFSTLDSPQTASPKPMKKSEPLISHLLSGHSGMLSESSIVTSVDSDDMKSIRNSFSGMVVGTLTTNVLKPNSLGENEGEEARNNASSSLCGKLTQRRPPKDFICPITGQLFDDPVTLETGQTYERRAIHEWLKRGNVTCPITRQPLSTAILPKTNYILKRLITSWKDRHPDLAREASDSPTASLNTMCFGGLSNSADSPTSHHFLSLTADNADYGIRDKRFMQAAVCETPTSVICQAAIETAISGLKPYVACLCTSEDLQELETAVLTIAKVLKDSKANQGICMHLSEPTTVSGLMEILSISVNKAVLRASIYILSELIHVNGSVGEALMAVDSDFDCLVTLLKNGLAETVVLIYLLEPAYSELSSYELIPSLLQVISHKCDDTDDFQFVTEPKDASIRVLQQILLGGDKTSQTLNVMNVISSNGIPALIECLTRVEERLHIVSMLLICMHADKSCRTSIAKNVNLAPVLELFQAGSDNARQICVDFFYEIICMNRGTLRKEILQVMNDGGAFCTMHNFLAYLQVAPVEQKPIVASLLLQLDLLVEPRKMSIYREESIDAFIEALYRKDLPTCQIIALNALSSLSGWFDASGNSLTEACLLKVSGLELPHTSLMKEGVTQIEEVVSPELMEKEEKANSIWEKQISSVLCNHDNGSIFKALEECSSSNSLELSKSWLVASTWLIHMLYGLPNIDTRVVACHCLLQQFMNVLQTSRNLEDRVLAGLALKNFASDQDTLKELGKYVTSICKPLRKLKRCSAVAVDTLRALMNSPSIDMRQFCSCTEVDRIDSSINGELLSFAYLRGRLFSSHSDGSIKVWNAGTRGLKLIQEVHVHTRAVTCLSIPFSGGKLYSGSLDKTIRVTVPCHYLLLRFWLFGQSKWKKSIVCRSTMLKRLYSVYPPMLILLALLLKGPVSRFDRHNIRRSINLSRNIKCLATMEGYLYCGCTDCTIQEVDLHKSTSTTFFSGLRKLLGRQAINSLCIDNGVLYAGGSSVDGTAGKAFMLSEKSAIGTFSTALDITSMAVDSDFVFTGTKCGMIEVWSRERLAWITSIKASGGTSTKITSLAVDSDGDMLFAGSSDGKIQVWTIH